MLNESRTVLLHFQHELKGTTHITMGAYIAQWLLTVLVLLFVVYKLHVITGEKENILFLFLEIPPEHTA